MPGNWINWLVEDSNGNLIIERVIESKDNIIGKGTLIDRFLLDNNWRRLNDTAPYSLLGYEKEG
jgi:hypothetical protein